MNGLNGNVVFVTGAGSGIGKQVALRLAREGGKIGVVDLRTAAAEETAAEIIAAGGDAVPLTADVTSAEQVQQAVETLVSKYGQLNSLVNCAGVALGEGGVVECSEAAWDKTMDINVKSIFLTGKYVIPHMIAAGGGSIVNIASVFGFVANPDECGYAASKGAVLNLTRQMAVQHAKDNIRVNSVCPSDCDTPLIAGLLGVEGAELEAAKAELASPIPFGRLAQPQEIAAGVAFLLSADSAFITGIALPIDGGFLTK